MSGRYVFSSIVHCDMIWGYIIFFLSSIVPFVHKSRDLQFCCSCVHTGVQSKVCKNWTGNKCDWMKCNWCNKWKSFCSDEANPLLTFFSSDFYPFFKLPFFYLNEMQLVMRPIHVRPILNLASKVRDDQKYQNGWISRKSPNGLVSNIFVAD